MTTMQRELGTVGSQMQVSRPGVMERMTQILDVFMADHERLLLEEIAAMTGLPRSTAFRILGQLVELRWVEHDSTGYRLGSRIRALGMRCRDHGALRSAAAETLNELHVATGAVAHLSVLDGATVHYLDKIGGAAGASVPSRVGARFPALHTVSGRALLAYVPPEDVDDLLTAVAGDCTGGGRDPARLHRHLARIRRRNGVAFAYGSRCPLGIGGVAVPILGPDGVIGAISTTGRGLPLSTLAPMVTFACRRVARALSPGLPDVDPGRRAG